MPAQLPETKSPTLFFVGDKHKFKVSGTDDGTGAPYLDGATWNNIVSAVLTLVPPGPTRTAITFDGALVGSAPGPWAYTYTFPATISGVSTVGVWDAYWTITDFNGLVETLGSYQFELKKKIGT